MRDAKVSDTFSSDYLLHLPAGTDLYDEARHQHLQEAVLKGLDLSRRERALCDAVLSNGGGSVFSLLAVYSIDAAPGANNG
ncbi:hypothetical protein AWENTII_003159 [Aspergillus wentii]